MQLTVSVFFFFNQLLDCVQVATGKHVQVTRYVLIPPHTIKVKETKNTLTGRSEAFIWSTF